MTTILININFNNLRNGLWADIVLIDVIIIEWWCKVYCSSLFQHKEGTARRSSSAWNESPWVWRYSWI